MLDPPVSLSNIAPDFIFDADLCEAPGAHLKTRVPLSTLGISSCLALSSDDVEPACRAVALVSRSFLFSRH